MEDYEERYNKLVNFIKDLYPHTSDYVKEKLEGFIPELRESEDEKIRKAQLNYWRSVGGKEWYGVPVQETIAWLEKQGEKNPSWSEEDEKLYTSALWHIKNSCGNGGKDSGEFEVYNWLKSLKDRVQPHPEQEWSEKDEKFLVDAINFLYRAKNEYAQTARLEECIAWLKSIKPNRWKPSEQNIKDLEWCADLVKDKMGVGFHRIQVFIDDLRKAMEE